MQKDSHHDLTGLLAVMSGIEPLEAAEIAWANQFTDDCKNFDKYDIRTMVDIVWNGTDCFIPEVQMNVFVPFHFLPGGMGPNKYVVIADSRLANTVVNKAFHNCDLIGIGIALHAYQDSYSHEHRTGTCDNANAKHPWDKTGLSSLPPRIGHAEFGRDPDIIWDGKKIDNREKFKTAAVKVYWILERYAISKGLASGLYGDKVQNWLDKELSDFWQISDYDERKKWLQVKSGLGTYSDYKPSKEQIKRFAAAAQKQQSIVLEYISQF